VPRGIVLIGAPKAQDQIEQFGEAVLYFQRDMEQELRQRGVGMGRIVPVMG
jgi:DNA repair protein RAD7